MKSNAMKVMGALPLAVVLASLVACGGGGSDSAPASTAPDTDTSTGGGATTGPTGPATGVSNTDTTSGTSGTGTTGSTATGGAGASAVKAPFAAAALPQYIWVGIGSQFSGPAASLTQQADGGVVAVGDVSLAGTDLSIVDKAGDENLAVGRWAAGTVTTKFSTDVMQGSNAAYHYAVFNALDTMPTSGSYQCDKGVFTNPSKINWDTTPAGYSAPDFGTATGTATLSFSPEGATTDVAISVAASGAKGATEYPGIVLTSPNVLVFRGGFFGGSEGMQVKVAEGPHGGKRVVVAYRATVAAAVYTGVAAFTCAAQ